MHVNPIFRDVDSGLSAFGVRDCSIKVKDCYNSRINHPSIKVGDCFIRVGDCSIRVYQFFSLFLCLHCFSDISKDFSERKSCNLASLIYRNHPNSFHHLLFPKLSRHNRCMPTQDEAKISTKKSKLLPLSNYTQLISIKFLKCVRLL